MCRIKSCAPLAMLAATATSANGFVTPPTPAQGRTSPERLQYRTEDSDSVQVSTTGGLVIVPHTDAKPISLPKVEKDRTQSKTRRRKHPRVESVGSVQEYEAAISNDDGRIVVVRFHSPWCPACKAALPRYKKMTSKYATEVKFVDMALTEENNALMRGGLGVPTVPYTHIYHPDAGLVEEMKMSKGDFPVVQKVLDDYVTGRCELPFFCFEGFDDDENDDELSEFQ